MCANGAVVYVGADGASSVRPRATSAIPYRPRSQPCARRHLSPESHLPYARYPGLRRWAAPQIWRVAETEGDQRWSMSVDVRPPLIRHHQAVATRSRTSLMKVIRIWAPIAAICFAVLVVATSLTLFWLGLGRWVAPLLFISGPGLAVIARIRWTRDHLARGYLVLSLLAVSGGSAIFVFRDSGMEVALRAGFGALAGISLALCSQTLIDWHRRIRGKRVGLS